MRSTVVSGTISCVIQLDKDDIHMMDDFITEMVNYLSGANADKQPKLHTVREYEHFISRLSHCLGGSPSRFTDQRDA